MATLGARHPTSAKTNAALSVSVTTGVGDLIVASASSHGSATAGTWGDTVNTYAQAAFVANGTACSAGIWWAVALTAATLTVTFTPNSGTSSNAMEVATYSGWFTGVPQTTPAVDGTNSVTSTNSTVTPSFTPTHLDGAMIATFGVNRAVTDTFTRTVAGVFNAGFTLGGAGTSGGGATSNVCCLTVYGETATGSGSAASSTFTDTSTGTASDAGVIVGFYGLPGGNFVYRTSTILQAVNRGTF